MVPVMVLSQPDRAMTPSHIAPRTASSIESAITSRETSEVFKIGRGCGCVSIFGDHSIFEAVFFERPDPHAAPAGYGHHFDEVFLGRADWAVFLEHILRERLERILAFARENDAFAEDAVFDGIAGGGESALLGDGATGFAAVGAGGFDLTVGSHNFAIRLSHGWGRVYR